MELLGTYDAGLLTWAWYRCQSCLKPTTMALKLDMKVDLHGLPTSMFEDYVTIVTTHPQPSKPPIVPGLPDRVRSALVDAHKCLLAKQFSPAAVMYRKAVERALSHTYPDLKGTLYQRIRKLEEQSVVPPVLILLLDVVRFLGNDGAHEDDDPTAEDVQAGHDFVVLLFTYLFDLPGRVEAALEKRKAI